MRWQRHARRCWNWERRYPRPACKTSMAGQSRLTTSPVQRLARCLLVRYCPYVRHIRAEFARFAQDFQRRRAAVVAINSNDVAASPVDGPEDMTQEAREVGYTFPYLFDGTQNVAKFFRAACTPDLFLFDGAQRLVYRGQFDDSRPKSSGPRDGEGSQGRGGRAAQREHRATRATVEHGLQHQVEGWRGAGLLRPLMRSAHGRTDSPPCFCVSVARIGDQRAVRARIGIGLSA